MRIRSATEWEEKGANGNVFVAVDELEDKLGGEKMQKLVLR